jgi:nucleotide-binding universal stress UspA family protein
MSGAYRHIGVASTFSPRFFAVLSEADRYARCFESPLSVIHAAPEHADGISRFSEALEKLGRASETEIIWSVADSPAEAILGACRDNQLDLLIAGALEREGEHRNFVGGVAHALLQRVPCDLLLMPKPAENLPAFQRVAVEVDLKRPAIDFLNRTCELATRLGAKEMEFIGIVTPFDEARAAKGDHLDEEGLAAIIDQASGFEGEVDFKVLHSTTGFAVCDFLQENGADLFIAGSRRKEGVRRLPTRLDWLLQVVPTNVLLVGIDA